MCLYEANLGWTFQFPTKCAPCPNTGAYCGFSRPALLPANGTDESAGFQRFFFLIFGSVFFVGWIPTAALLDCYIFTAGTHETSPTSLSGRGEGTGPNDSTATVTRRKVVGRL